MIINIDKCDTTNDGICVYTHILQSAIDRCYENGGGTVTVSTGKYITGSGTIEGCAESFYGGELHKLSNCFYREGYYDCTFG